MTRYRHRTTEVEAVQWTGTNADALRAFCGPDFDEIEPEDRTENPDASAAVRESKHGTWRGLEPGYWVVKIGEEFYEESPADFAAQFEPVPSAVPAPAADRAVGVTDAIRTFPFDNFGMDDVSFALEDDPEAQEWVPALADAVLATLPATAAQAVELRDYWHAEAMSATTRIIELEGQLEELRPRLADGPPAAAPAATSVGQAAHTTRSAALREAADYAEATAEMLRSQREFKRSAGALDVMTVLRRLADETQPAEGEAHPPTRTWKVESPRRDKWASWGATHDERVWAAASYDDVIEVAPQRPFRLVRATTTYAVEAEHQPAAVSQPGKER